MEYLEGVPLTDLAAVSRVTSLPPDEVLINALNTWFSSLTACPTFHADVHAGISLLPAHLSRISDVHLHASSRMNMRKSDKNCDHRSRPSMHGAEGLLKPMHQLTCTGHRIHASGRPFLHFTYALAHWRTYLPQEALF